MSIDRYTSVDILKFSAGQVIVFSQGEYSDYSIGGFLVATRALDLPALAQEMANGKNEHSDPDADPYNFPAWLIKNGYAMPIDHSVVHVGDYSRWAPEFGVILGDE